VCSFDTIPHDGLLSSVAARIVDRHILRLIKMWLKTPVEETDPDGRRRMSGGKRSTCGTPQGGVISPLLANRYMNRFLRHWRQQGRREAFRAEVVNYADDFVILSRGHAQEALTWTRRVMTRLGLTVNEAKTTVRDARQERFDFLGYSFGPHHYRKGRSLVFGGESIVEERATPQDARGGDCSSLQHRALGRGARPVESSPAWLGNLLRLWHAADGLPGGRSSCL